VSAEELLKGERVRGLINLERQARTRLARLDAATSLGDLRAFRGNRLEALAGGRKGQFSIRIHDPYRICFVWSEKGPSDVELPATTKLPPVHPGETLREDLADEGISINGLAQALRVPRQPHQPDR
jgi:toxin HigB-1